MQYSFACVECPVLVTEKTEVLLHTGLSYIVYCHQCLRAYDKDTQQPLTQNGNTRMCIYFDKNYIGLNKDGSIRHARLIGIEPDDMFTRTVI